MKKSQLITLPFSIGEQLWVNLGPLGVKPCVFTYANVIRGFGFSEERFFFSLIDDDSTMLSEFVLDFAEAQSRVFRRRELAETTTFYTSVHLIPFTSPRRLSDTCWCKNNIWRLKP